MGTRNAAAGETRHHLVLPLEVVLREDEEVARLEPRDQSLVLRRAARLVVDLEEEGLVRDARFGRAERRHLELAGAPAAGVAASRPAPADLIEIALSAEHGGSAQRGAQRRRGLRDGLLRPGPEAAPMPKKPWIMPS